MRKIISTALGAALMAASTVQAAAAAQHHHARKVERAISAERFRNAHDAATSPAHSPPRDAAPRTEDLAPDD